MYFTRYVTRVALMYQLNQASKPVTDLWYTFFLWRRIPLWLPSQQSLQTTSPAHTHTHKNNNNNNNNNNKQTNKKEHNKWRCEGEEEGDRERIEAWHQNGG